MAYLDKSPDPFHATQNACDRLAAAGFVAIDEKDAWTGKLAKGGRYYFTRNRSCIVAFAVGGAYEPGNGFKVIGAHTDSPNLRVKPRSKRSNAGITQLSVECYGGGLWHTWFDRDLSLSGRVMLRSASGGVEQRLVRIPRPVLRVPTLCIHLQSTEEREAFKVNKEDHLQPILATEALKSLSGDASVVSESAKAAASEGASETPLGEAGAVAGAEVPTGGESSAERNENKAAAEYYDASSVHGWANGQEPLLVSMLAEELGVPAESILDFECSLFDTQPAALSGVHSEFLVSSRLDNLASCFVATEALLEHAPSAEAIKDDPDVSLIALFDHEEVGSGSTSGAGSPVMGDAVRRISSALSGGGTLADDVLAAALSKSFVLSADMAHAVHPNYASKHEKSHGPQMNRGIVSSRASAVQLVLPPPACKCSPRRPPLFPTGHQVQFEPTVRFQRRHLVRGPRALAPCRAPGAAGVCGAQRLSVRFDDRPDHLSEHGHARGRRGHADAQHALGARGHGGRRPDARQRALRRLPTRFP